MSIETVELAGRVYRRVADGGRYRYAVLARLKNPGSTAWRDLPDNDRFRRVVASIDAALMDRTEIRPFLGVKTKQGGCKAGA